MNDRYFLMRNDNGIAWFILDAETDHIGAWEHGKPSMAHTACIESAKTLSELLGKLRASGDENVYITLNWISSHGKTKKGVYPGLYHSIARIIGYIEDVCDIRPGERNRSKKETWRIDYPGDLWMMTDEWTLKRVFGFEQKINNAVDEYIKEHGLKFDEEEKGNG